jgi:hypothetical protein
MGAFRSFAPSTILDPTSACRDGFIERFRDKIVVKTKKRPSAATQCRWASKHGYPWGEPARSLSLVCDDYFPAAKH